MRVSWSSTNQPAYGRRLEKEALINRDRSIKRLPRKKALACGFCSQLSAIIPIM